MNSLSNIPNKYKNARNSLLKCYSIHRSIQMSAAGNYLASNNSSNGIRDSLKKSKKEIYIEKINILSNEVQEMRSMLSRLVFSMSFQLSLQLNNSHMNGGEFTSTSCKLPTNDINVQVNNNNDEAVNLDQVFMVSYGTKDDKPQSCINLEETPFAISPSTDINEIQSQSQFPIDVNISTDDTNSKLGRVKMSDSSKFPIEDNKSSVAITNSEADLNLNDSASIVTSGEDNKSPRANNVSNVSSQTFSYSVYNKSLSIIEDPEVEIESKDSNITHSALNETSVNGEDKKDLHLPIVTKNQTFSINIRMLFLLARTLYHRITIHFIHVYKFLRPGIKNV